MNDELRPLSNDEIVRHWKVAVKKAREAEGMNQEDIGRRIGLPKQTVSKYLNESGPEISDRFKPLALFIETARTSPAALNELRPLLGYERLESGELEDRQLLEAFRWLKAARRSGSWMALYETLRLTARGIDSEEERPE